MLISKDRYTGAVLAELETTPLERIPEMLRNAREASKRWAQVSTKERAERILRVRERLVDSADFWIDLISRENGKPPTEAITSDVLPTLDLMTYFGRRAPKILRDRSLPLVNPILLHRKSSLTFRPLGAVAVISPWNFPFFLPMGEIVMALLAGNAVLFKPSEVTPLIGSEIQKLFEPDLPPHTLQTLLGDGSVGAQLVEAGPDKIFFTGSVATGKRIMALAAAKLTPVNLELGGKDPMIVLEDADLDYASSAALWGGFANSGQVCASTERLLVHEKIRAPLIEKIKEKANTLRFAAPNDPSPAQADLGFLTFDRQNQVYTAQIKGAKDAGLRFDAGGEYAVPNRQLKPTLVSGDTIEASQIYSDETFGPVLAVTTFRSDEEAIQKANATRYGLAASVITSDLKRGQDIAKALECGTVCINEVLYTAAIPEAPWGGPKDTGSGKKHSDSGLLEFCQVQHIHAPRSNSVVFKSWWWFPYSSHQFQTFRLFLQFYRRNWVLKILNIPLFLLSFVTFLKKEPRV